MNRKLNHFGAKLDLFNENARDFVIIVDKLHSNKVDKPTRVLRLNDRIPIKKIKIFLILLHQAYFN